MKTFLALFFALLPALAFGQVNVQKSQGGGPNGNQVSNGPVIFGAGNLLQVLPGGTINLTGATQIGIVSSDVQYTGITGVPSLSVLGNLTGSTANASAISVGSVSESTSSVLSFTGQANSVLGAGLTIQVKQAATSQSGYLSSTDWNAFNGKQPAGAYITALTGDGAASGPGSAALTLATVNSNVGNFASVTINAKGLATAGAALSQDVTTTGSVATVVGINDTSLAGLATGILYNTTSTGVPGIVAYTGGSLGFLGGVLKLSGDSANPGDNYVYSTDAGGTKGWYPMSSEGVSSIAGTANQVTASASTGSVTLSIPSAFVLPGTINGLTISTSTGTLTIQNGVTLNSGAVGGTLGSGAFQPQTVLTGTANQIAVSNSGVGATTLSMVSSAILPGSPAVQTPGTSAGSIATIDGTQTLTGKSIAGSEINSGTVAGAYLAAINVAASGNGGITGTLAGANFPALTGDVTNSAGSLATTVGKIGGNAVSLAGAFTMSGAYGFTGTLTGTTAVTFPTSGTLSTAAGGNPTANIGASAVNGSSSNFMRSDAAPALGIDSTLHFTSTNLGFNLANPNTWAAAQTFPTADIVMLGSSTGSTTFASANAGASNFTITFPAATGTVALTSGIPSAANPTATINSAAGTVTNGSAATFMRSDGAPALPSSMTGVNSITAAASTDLTLSGGSSGNKVVVTNPTFTATSGAFDAFAVTPTYNQASGTAANTDFLVNRTQTAVGSGAQLLMDLQVGGGSKFNVDNAGTGTFSGSLSVGGSVGLGNGHALYGDTTNAHTWLEQFYYTTGTAYETFLTATNGSTPSVVFGPSTHGTAALGNGVTATTQSPGDNSTKVATTAFAIATSGTGGVNSYASQTLSFDTMPVSLTSGTASNVVTLTLGVGHWLVSGVAVFTLQSTTVPSIFATAISTTSGSIGLIDGGNLAYDSYGSALAANTFSIKSQIPPATFINVTSGTVQVWLVSLSNFTLGTVVVGGTIKATPVP